jgi:hypothetical protein
MHVALEVSASLLLKFAIGHDPEPVLSIPITYSLRPALFLSLISLFQVDFSKKFLSKTFLYTTVLVWFLHALPTAVFLPSLS